MTLRKPVRRPACKTLPPIILVDMDRGTIVNLVAMTIVAGIAIYSIRKKHLKDRSYFGGPADLSKADKKTLEYHKAIYRPIKTDSRLPNLRRDKFELEDVALTATEIVFENPLPTQDVITSLRKEHLVKLLFRDNDGDVERMWTEITEVEDEIFKGVLQNDALSLDGLTSGTIVYFHRNHIFDINKG